MDPNNSGTKSSGAPENLFKVDEDCEKLSLDKAKGLHNLVVITIYTTNRDKPDNFKPVALLTTRVRETDTYNWRNLDHLMKYLRKTRNLPLILVAGGACILKWWIEKSFTVHLNIRGHTGGGLSMGRVLPVVTSTNKYLNTQSSTEADIVRVDDCMSEVC